LTRLSTKRADRKRLVGRGFQKHGVAALVVTGLLAATTTAASAQGGREERPEVDPYTRDELEAMAEAGYSSFGPFVFGEGHTSETVTARLGNVPLLWLETPHFRIGCSLDEYRSEDKEERKKLRSELVELAKVLPRVKPKVRELDPWLRAHLFAWRLENLHARLCEVLGVLPSEAGPVEGKARVGAAGPMSILLVERESSLSRYTQEYCQVHRDDAHTEYFAGTRTFVYGIAADSIEAGDTALHYAVTFGVAQALAFSINDFSATPPRWWTAGIGRYFARLVDRECQLYASAGGEALPSDELADWESLVLGRVKASYYPDWASTLAWTDDSKMKFADHIMLWSRMDYLFDQDPGVVASLVESFHAPVSHGEDVAVRFGAALEKATGKDLDGIDADWARWVSENYSKRGRKKRRR